MKQFCIAIDQLLNCCLFFLPGGAWADETLSARAWRIREQWPSLHVWIDGIFFWQHNHCRQSYSAELNRRQSPPEERLYRESNKTS